MTERRKAPPPPRLWAGANEPIFGSLPESVIANFHNPRSENALMWNLLYPRAQPTLSLADLLALETLWGTGKPAGITEDQLIPFYWGYNVDGSRLLTLDEILLMVDGPGPRTEVDLFLLGKQLLLAVEVKHTSAFGRCARYGADRCPEIHVPDANESSCRYWEPGPALFSDELSVGPRPEPGSARPPCDRHYQLSRTFKIGRALAGRLQRDFGMWSIAPEKRWRSLEKTWLDFSERVLDDSSWRALRVISWEQIESLPPK